MRQRLAMSASLIGANGLAVAEDLPPLEAYGALPEFDMFVLSPSGEFAATRNNSTEEDLILILDIAQDKYLASVDAGESNPSDLEFVADYWTMLTRYIPTREVLADLSV